MTVNGGLKVEGMNMVGTEFGGRRTALRRLERTVSHLGGRRCHMSSCSSSSWPPWAGLFACTFGHLRFGLLFCAVGMGGERAAVIALKVGLLA